MNKADLISEIAAGGGITKKEAGKVLETILDSISTTLAEGNKVTIPKFGTFKVADLAARTGRNPRTGQSIKIGARKKASFSAGAGLKSAISGIKTGGGGPGKKA